jgi:hypothetical protein
MLQLSFNWQLMKYEHFDTCNGALLARESSHFGHAVPKFSVEMVFKCAMILQPGGEKSVLL